MRISDWSSDVCSSDLKLARDRMFQIGRDLHILAAIDRADILDARDFLRKADAARALDAAGHPRLDDRPHIFFGARALVLVIATRAAALGERLVLHIAFEIGTASCT